MEEVGSQVVYLLLMADSFKNLSIPHSKCIALSGITTFIFEELYTRKRPTVIQKALKSLIASSIHTELEICNLALQCINSLSSVFTEIVMIDMNLGYSIIIGLCENVIDLFDIKKSGPKNNRTDIIMAHFNTLLEFLLNEPNVLSKQQYIQKVMDAIEGALNLQSNAFDVVPIVPKEEPEVKKGSRTGTILARKTDKDKKEKGKDKKSESVSNLNESIIVNEAKTIQNVKELAESLLRQLLVYYSNFPTPNGPEIMFCKEYELPKNADEEMNKDTHHFIYGNTIVSFKEVRSNDRIAKGMKPEESFVRITLRDCIGNFLLLEKIISVKKI